MNLFDDPTETLHYGQEYSISLLFDLPESDANFDIGIITKFSYFRSNLCILHVYFGKENSLL